MSLALTPQVIMRYSLTAVVSCLMLRRKTRIVSRGEQSLVGFAPGFVAEASFQVGYISRPNVQRFHVILEAIDHSLVEIVRDNLHQWTILDEASDWIPRFRLFGMRVLQHNLELSPLPRQFLNTEIELLEILLQRLQEFGSLLSSALGMCEDRKWVTSPLLMHRQPCPDMVQDHLSSLQVLQVGGRTLMPVTVSELLRLQQPRLDHPDELTGLLKVDVAFIGELQTTPLCGIPWDLLGEESSIWFLGCVEGKIKSRE